MPFILLYFIADSPKESLNKAGKNIDAIKTTDQKADQLDICATENIDTKNQILMEILLKL